MTREEIRAKIIEMIYELETVKSDNIAYGKSYEEQEKRIKVLLMAIEALQTEPCEDCISRQAVHDMLENLPVTVEDKWFNWLQKACIRLAKLPSVQPEIIRCHQCKYAEVADLEDSQDGYTCQFHRGSIWFSGSYCSWAERRQDG